MLVAPGPQPRRLLEVEADDLVRRAACSEQVGGIFVQARPLDLRRREVRRLVDQRVSEAEALLEGLRRRRRVEQAAAYERRKRLACAA